MRGRIQAELDLLPSLIRPKAYGIWRAVEALDHRGHVTDITAFFACSLKVPQQVSYHVRIAHGYMWMAYTLYDDVLDDDESPLSVAVANCLQRLALSHNASLNDAFSTMDNANVWELLYARDLTVPPDYEDGQVLTERAWGHIADCIALVSPSDRERVATALSHYIVARQLNDDLHDWVKDFQNGHVSYVVTALLKAANEPKELSQLKRLFWKSELERLCGEVINRIDTARELLAPLLVENSLFDHTFLEPIHKVAHQALNVHRANKELVEAAYNREHV